MGALRAPPTLSHISRHSSNSTPDQNHRSDNNSSASDKTPRLLRPLGEMASRSGPRSTTYKCLRLPADGGTPDLLDYSTIPPLPKSYDRSFNVVADLREYWDGDYLALLMQTFCVEDYKIPAVDGQYLIYYSTDSSRPPNKTLLSMPLLHRAVERSTKSGDIFDERLFYRGDVFVVRLSEWEERTDFKSQHDNISPELVRPLIELLDKAFFAENWERRFLERQRRDDEEMDKDLRKHEAFRAAFMSRVPLEKQNDPEVKRSIDLLAAMSLLGSRK